MSDNSFVENRARLASDSFDPYYGRVEGLDVVAHRNIWNVLLDIINNFHEEELKKMYATEPKNPHEAALLHTGMINAFNKAKDDSMRYMLACAGDKHTCADEEQQKDAARARVAELIKK